MDNTPWCRVHNCYQFECGCRQETLIKDIDIFNNEGLELLKEAEKRFKKYQMDVDSDAPFDHRIFMRRLQKYISKQSS